ncbi:hypothetical protein IEZ26_15840 [Nocardioides cavernae]|uniref:Uncharacterized protein n=1 Tax=Nocardioides cavernae TaxID=1921566 RepID=A0ABR8NDA3_9ACTN|nr:hypothetical protein [Nocardioides cavernae]MBD3926096.1 hypothetical protein [Nocardioides cavernae]MBM7513685.1 hypothetical protein [Nocardioides cavernae]
MTRQHTAPLEPSPWPPTGPVDLKTFIRNLGASRARGSATSTQYRRTAMLVERAAPRMIEAAPLEPIGFLDAVQRRALVGRRNRLDISLVFLAAGTVLGNRLLNVEERLAVLCSVQDEQFVRAALSDVPVVALPDLLPWGVASATDGWIDETRRRLEERALEGAPRASGHFVVVDGSLPPHASRLDAVGVIKTTATDWLIDESSYPYLGGWRSPALLLPPSRAGDRARLSCLVRLRDVEGCHAYDYSLVRVECFEEAGIETLEAVAALAVQERQPLTSGDPRAEVHMRSMRTTEDVLRTRVPVAFQVLP